MKARLILSVAMTVVILAGIAGGTKLAAASRDSEVATLLTSRTLEAWDTALADARDQAHAVLADAQALVRSAGPMAPAPFAAGVAGWPHEIATAPTPIAVRQLATRYGAELDGARTQVRAAQARAAAEAQAAAEVGTVKNAGGVDQLLSAVAGIDETAAADNLDAGPVDSLAAQVRQQAAAGQVSSATAAALATAIATFRNTVKQNDQVAAALQPLQWEVDQAIVEKTPGSASFGVQVQPLQQAFSDARTADQIGAVLQRVTTLKAAVDKDLADHVCGHDVPGGKVLLFSLSLQELVVYQDGCAVRGTPITTGRPQLPTPPGTYHVFYKTSPFTMVSPWEKPSPFWYPTTTVTWVMEFLGGGYFIHDADWEAPGDYGPGSQNNPNAASHGCIHIQTPVMEWLYSWTPVGTEVIVQP